MSPELFADRYAGYLYAYPHKSAYRRFDPPIDLVDVWAHEPMRSTFLYVHVPFCEMRCGYCNLFTQARPAGGTTEAWLDALGRQAQATAHALPGSRSITRIAIGGGTPTILEPDQLEKLFDLLGAQFGADPHRAPMSVEVSPRTADPARLGVLAGRGVERISIGIESFDEADLRALGRPQRIPVVQAALESIRSAMFPILNIDLIYGAAGQSLASFKRSLLAALEWMPEELYLYPLYCRPLTGLGGVTPEVHDRRPAMYDLACDLLGSAGYEQISMRMFRRSGLVNAGPSRDNVPDYDCQDDGMIGIGCGARSYTSTLHYSHNYAVSRSAVTRIIEDYISLSGNDHGRVDHGVVLSDDEQRRRYVIKGILRRPGLDLAAYCERFGSSAVADFPELALWEREGVLKIGDGFLCPTDEGLAWSDAMGSALVSQPIRDLMRDCEIA